MTREMRHKTKTRPFAPTSVVRTTRRRRLNLGSGRRQWTTDERTTGRADERTSDHVRERVVSRGPGHRRRPLAAARVVRTRRRSTQKDDCDARARASAGSHGNARPRVDGDERGTGEPARGVSGGGGVQVTAETRRGRGFERRRRHGVRARRDAMRAWKTCPFKPPRWSWWQNSQPRLDGWIATTEAMECARGGLFLSTRLCRYPSRVSRAFGEATGSSRANEQFEFDRLTPLFTSVQGV